MQLTTLMLTGICCLNFHNAFSIESLDDYLSQLGVTQEQNAGHMNITPIYDAKALFYQDLLISNPQIKTIAEIGFCLGHSSDVYLSTRSDISMVSFDLMSHWYCDAGKTYIDLKHPHRNTLIKGDSLITVPKYKKTHPNTKFDLIIVDGGHEYLVALQDIINMSHFAKKDTILIVDDTEYEPVQRAWNECKKMRLVEELEVRTESGFGWTRGKYLK